MQQLENKIREALPRLSKIEKGQRFLSKYYGVITATQIDDLGDGKYSIYGFDELEGLPRSDYYPRDLELIGHPIKLNDVLEYYKNSNFEHGVNMMFESEWKNGCHYIVNNWDFSSVFLADQSNEIKEFLNNL